VSPRQLKTEEQALVCLTPAQPGDVAAPSRKGAAVASTAPGARPSAWLERPMAANSSSAAASPPASSAARLPTWSAGLLVCEVEEHYCRVTSDTIRRVRVCPSTVTHTFILFQAYFR